MLAKTHSIVRSAAAMILVLAAIFFAVRARYQPPEPKPADAPASEFSSARAQAVLQELVGDGIPHPLGSAQVTIVRDRILTRLRALGYAPEIHTSFACDNWGTCGTADNIVAVVPGTEPGQGILLAAHYDSVAAGPGASDDGAGVATILEIARALKSLPPNRHPIYILIDDGEEAGLLGAEAFVQHDPLARQIYAAVNIEARGTSGPSLMFETGRANEWLMELYSRSVPHPITDSVFYAVYKLLPNDTDFTVFRRAGMQGFNFAYIGDVSHYHTPLDNFANANPRSIQHHGDNALGTVLALANADLGRHPPREDVFFDVLAWRVIRWPASDLEWMWPLCLAALLFVVGRVWRKGLLAPGQLGWGILLCVMSILAAAIFSAIVQLAFSTLRGFPTRWLAHPSPAIAVFVAIAFFASAFVGNFMLRRAGFWGAWAGVWLLQPLAAAALAHLLPGACYIFLVPVAVAAVTGFFAAAKPEESGWRRCIAIYFPAAVSALLVMQVTWFLYDALGTLMLAGVAAQMALILSAFLPAFADMPEGRTLLKWFAVAPLILAAILIFVATREPVYTQQFPQKITYMYVADASLDRSYWTVSALPSELAEPIQRLEHWLPSSTYPFPWSRDFSTAEAPSLGLTPPSVTVMNTTISGATETVTLHVQSARGVPGVAVMFGPGSDVGSVFVQGQPVPPISTHAQHFFSGWRIYELLDPAPEGMTIRFSVPMERPLSVGVFDESNGLPANGEFLLRARPSDAVPFEEGDRTVTINHLPILK